MIKNIWGKIRQNHLVLMILCCLIPIVLIIGFPSLLRRGGGNWSWLIILLCPLLHILMMGGHKHNNICEKESNKESREEVEYKCQECGLKYKEKEWAGKCEVWCKTHKSCNLEIIKYAIDNSREKNN